jgi:hypothetical protein
MKAKQLLFSLLLLGGALTLSGCEKDEIRKDPLIEVDEEGNTRFNNNLQTSVDNLPTEELNAGELASLAFIREEEKLARDIYLSLFNLWGKNVFTNISSSESTHMEAVLVLLNKYNLEDPVGGSDLGAFEDPELQALYNDLFAYGQVSLIQALEVGARVEEVDILDIQTDLDDFVDNQDIILVYENLMKGSRNHLRSFVRNLAQEGIVYQPVYLDQESYNAIISAPMENGNN